MGEKASEDINNEDQVKIDTWYYLTNLLEHYRMLTFDPMYQSGLRLLASPREKEMRERKIEIIRQNHIKLQDRWEKALGPNWRDAFEQD